MHMQTFRILEAYQKVAEDAVPPQNTVAAANAQSAAAPAQQTAQQPAQQQKPTQQPVAAPQQQTAATQTAKPPVQQQQQTAQPTVQQPAAAQPAAQPQQPQQPAAPAAPVAPQPKVESAKMSSFKAYCGWKKNGKGRAKPLTSLGESEAENVALDGTDGEIDGRTDGGDDAPDADEEVAIFLAETGTTVSKKLLGNEVNPKWNDNNSRNKYRVTLKNGNGSFSFVFWDSAVATEPPTDRDVLYAFATDVGAYERNPHFEDFAAEFGYDVDDPSAKKIFAACRSMHDRAMKLFASDDIRRLSMLESTCEACSETVDPEDGLMEPASNAVNEGGFAPQGETEVYLDTFNPDEDWESAADEFDRLLGDVPQGDYLVFLIRYDNRYNGTFGPPTGDYGKFIGHWSDFETLYSDLLSKCRGCDSVRVECDGRFVFITLGHHDGVEKYVVVSLNDKGGEAFFDENQRDKDVAEFVTDEFVAPIESLRL